MLMNLKQLERLRNCATVYIGFGVQMSEIKLKQNWSISVLFQLLEPPDLCEFMLFTDVCSCLSHVLSSC